MMMKKLFTVLLLGSVALSSVQAHENHGSHDSAGHTPGDLKLIGDSHGEIAVAENGEIYVSVLGGPKAGIQVYDSKGKYLRNIPGAPKDFHGFTLLKEGDKQVIYGAGLDSGVITKMDLQGKVLLQIKPDVIPDKYKKKGKTPLKLTAVSVGPQGELYVVDGYGLDFIHKFSAEGKYLKTFGGREAPYHFNNLHKIYVDMRFEPARLLCTNRAKGTLVHLSLDGKFIEIHAEKLRRPSAVAFRGEEIALAEINGRVTLLNKEGEITATLSRNDQKYRGNRAKPEEWEDGIVWSPHGICYDNEGNVLVTEYSKWGRVLKFSVPEKQKKTEED
ncbi:hypothetical protein Rhal01_00659 [Rubritalea halochordaticola]|uniref:6-bladed beta-propeller n=1 Tax=Rubritalea halochordaticola TaxID=714537 RepID=A0ABP9UVL1_9BACT